jgi:hypothetical protein
MPTKRIKKEIWDRFEFCNHPEHNPPNMIVLPPGVYEHTCPRCHHKKTFIVRQEPRLEFRG